MLLPYVTPIYWRPWELCSPAFYGVFPSMVKVQKLTNWRCCSHGFFPLWSIAERKGAKDDWLRRRGVGGWGGGCFRCLFSCFSEICVIAPVGWTLTVSHVHHSREVNSSEFQWPCWPRLFGFYGERGPSNMQWDNKRLLPHCLSSLLLFLSFFFFQSQSLNH